ncbi:MAG: type II toxin-antitoxin system prevent-host-death family antitoxin [Acidobacteriota bacterium]|nr:type II toxin-antitoxin system prevent-host-death family antitoxin [Acidobacteriota bacterium]
MINKALEGEEVIITRNGTETVRLVPVAKRKKWVGMYAGQVKIHDSFFEPLDDETLAYFTGDAKTALDDL